MTEIRSEMTVNYNFDLEDDDYFADNFLSSISEKDLLTSTAVTQKPAKHPTENTEIKDINQTATATFDLDCTIEDTKNDYLNKTKEVLLSNVPIDSRKQDKQLSVLSPLPVSSKDSLNVNSRFIPGFTPKAKKRKFPGPAGIYSQQNKLPVLSCDLEKTSPEKLEEDLEVTDITSSQFTGDDLLLPSWQNLQKDVSSCQSLLSTAKYHSIHRVLNETSKKKLPKHVVVPVLCVMIKKFKHEDSSLLLIDDTGEISGKIYKDVLEEYKEHIKVGTALILRKVTSLCNVLLLKKPCMASIYLEDGSVKHIHELNSLLDKDGPLKQMGCECSGTPKANGIAAILKMCDAAGCSKTNANKKTLNLSKQNTDSNSRHNFSSPNIQQFSNVPSIAMPKTDSSGLIPSARPSISKVSNRKTLNLSKQNVDSNSRHNFPSPNIQRFSNLSTIATSKTDSSGLIPSVRQSISNVSVPKSTNKDDNFNGSCIMSEAAGSANESKVDLVSIPTKNSGGNDDLFCDDLEMDEFDELLCSLDEKSFLEEI